MTQPSLRTFRWTYVPKKSNLISLRIISEGKNKNVTGVTLARKRLPEQTREKTVLNYLRRMYVETSGHETMQREIYQLYRKRTNN